MDLPWDFKERIRRQLGEAGEDFLACYEKERVYGLRCNLLKIKPDRLKGLLFAAGIDTQTVPWAKEGFYYAPDVQPGKLPLHEAGAYYIQEPSAMIAAELLDPAAGDRVLDLCAAPGGKSTQIAARLQGTGLLVSNEIVGARAKILSRNIERMGIKNAVVLREEPGRLTPRFMEFFDRILVDAPCSGEGMFRKDENARGEWSLQRTLSCAQRQRGILRQAARMLKPGGRLVYSTCTFAPQENEETAEWFVQEFPQFTLDRTEQVWPHLHRGEGHFAACFQKDDTLLLGREAGAGFGALSGGGKKRSKGSAGTHSALAKKDAQAVSAFCRETLSEETAARMEEYLRTGNLVVFGGQICLLPSGLGSLDGLKTERAGLEIGWIRKGRLEPSHAFAMALHPKDVIRVAELAEPMRYLHGESISCSGQNGWTLAVIDGCSVGWGKVSQGVLKNHYPKGLRLQW